MLPRSPDMLAPVWLLLLCLSRETLQKGVPSRANGGLGRMLLPSVMRGAGAQPAAGVPPMVSKGLGPRMIVNGYGMGTIPRVPTGGLANGRQGAKAPGFAPANGFPRGPLPLGVPGGIGGKRKPGYGIPRNGFPTGYQNGLRNGQAGQRLVPGHAKQGYGNGVGRLPGPGVLQPAYANGYRNGHGYLNGYGPGYGAGILNGYGGTAGLTNGAGLQPGAAGKGLGPAGYGGVPGITNGAGLQPGAAGKGLGPAGYGVGVFPGIQAPAGYGNGFPSVLADGAAYGMKPGKDAGAGQELYPAPQVLTNGLSVDAAAAKYGAGLPFNGQAGIPAGLGAGLLSYEMPQQPVRMVPDAASAKYGDRGPRYGLLSAGLPQGLAAGGYGQFGPVPAQQLGAKDGKYPMNGYYGNGYGGCVSGKCGSQGRK